SSAHPSKSARGFEQSSRQTPAQRESDDRGRGGSRQRQPVGFRSEKPRTAQSRRTGGLRYFHAREGSSFHHVWPPRPQLLSGGNCRAGAGPSLRRLWRRRSQSHHYLRGDDRETPRQEFPRHRPWLLQQRRRPFETGAQGVELSALEGKGIPQDGGRSRTLRRKGIFNRRATLGTSNAGIERHMGRIH